MPDRDEEDELDRHLTHPPPKSHLWLWVISVGIVIVFIVLLLAMLIFTERDDPTQLAPTPIEPPRPAQPQPESTGERPTLPSGGGSPIDSH
ncbi:MAG: hypothetical protein WD294_01285 [Phycisphaeraceae bacterium]